MIIEMGARCIFIYIIDMHTHAWKIRQGKTMFRKRYTIVMINSRCKTDDQQRYSQRAHRLFIDSRFACRCVCVCVQLAGCGMRHIQLVIRPCIVCVWVIDGLFRYSAIIALTYSYTHTRMRSVAHRPKYSATRYSCMQNKSW